MAAITLYQFPGEGGLSISPYCNKVHWALRLKGLLYRTESVLFPRLVSTTGALPVLTYDGQKLHDSTEILHFLETRHPLPALIPKDPRHAAQAHVLEDWADEALHPVVQYLSWKSPWALSRFSELVLPTLPPALARLGLANRRRRILLAHRNLARRGDASAYALLNAHLDAINALGTERSWLVGDCPSIADIAVAAQLYTLTLGATPDALAKLCERSHVNAWFQRFLSRAARSETR